MMPPIKWFLILVGLAAVLVLAGSVPWTSKTVIDISAVDEAGSPLPGVQVSLISGPGGILAEGTTNDAGVLILKYSPDPNTDWGKHVWRFGIFINGYVTKETPVSMSESRVGTIRAWLPIAKPGDEKPHLRFLIQTKLVCRKVS